MCYLEETNLKTKSSQQIMIIKYVFFKNWRMRLVEPEWSDDRWFARVRLEGDPSSGEGKIRRGGAAKLQESMLAILRNVIDGSESFHLSSFWL